MEEPKNPSKIELVDTQVFFRGPWTMGPVGDVLDKKTSVTASHEQNNEGRNESIPKGKSGTYHIFLYGLSNLQMWR